jgi:hypothetical protein
LKWLELLEAVGLMGKGLFGLLGLKGYVPGLLSAIFKEATLCCVE